MKGFIYPEAQTASIIAHLEPMGLIKLVMIVTKHVVNAMEVNLINAWIAMISFYMTLQNKLVKSHAMRISIF